MSEDEYREAVIDDIMRQIKCTKQEAANLVGDLDDVLEPMTDGLSPTDLASEILMAG